MANFFADIIQKINESAARGNKIIEDKKSQATAVTPRPEIGTSGNFFQDIADNFNLSKPQEFVKQPAPEPQKAKAVPPDVSGFAKDVARSFPRQGAGAVLETIERIKGLPAGSLSITPGKGETAFGPKIEKIIFGEEPVKSTTKQGQEFLESIGLPKNLVEKGGLPTGLFFLGLDVLPGGAGEKKIAKEVLEKTLPGLKALKVTEESAKSLAKVIDDVIPELKEIKGKTLTHAEVVEAAKTSPILQKITTREETLAREATVLRTKQHAAAMAEGKGMTSEFVETVKRLSSEASAYGRQLESLKAPAGSELYDIKAEMVRKLANLGVETDKIVAAANDIDFNNAKQVQEFYRKFVKPTFGEVLDEYRYINLLSSPKTHIVNTFTNLLNAGLVNPATKLTSGIIDNFYSGISRSERLNYVSEVPAYYKGVFNSTGDAVSKALKIFRGEQTVFRPDLNKIPTGTKLLAPFQAIPRMLEASDVLFRTLIEGGEKEALALKYSKQGTFIDEAVQESINQIARSKGEYYVFRQALDPLNKSGQGVVLSQIDKLTTAVYELRNVPGVKWFIPFVQTPMNILKQGLEFSPFGVTTLIGNTNKIEQLSKATAGSMVFMGAGYIAAKGDSTWALPRDKKERDYFYASGRQPYSIKIGDKWVSYSRLGPLAYPIALAAAIKHYTEDDPKAITKSDLEKISSVMAGMAGFLSDQSYIEGIGNLVDAAQGDEEAIAKAASQLPSQLIPLSSLQRWVADFVDPVFRKSQPGLSTEAIIQNLKKGIPGLSKELPAYKTPLTQEEEKKQYPVARALSPVGVTKENKRYEDLYQILLKKRTMSAKVSQIKEDLRKKLGL